MKVVQRGIMNVVPGKMAEYMELLEKYMAIVSRLMEIPREMIPMRMYRPFLGGGDPLHTVIFEVEWDSLAAMAAFFEKAMADPEMPALMPKYDALIESHTNEFYMPMP